MEGNEFLTIYEASQITGKCQNTIHRYIKKGKLVHTKNTLPKHRTQSHSRPVLGHITGIHTIVIIIPIFTNGRKCRLNAVFSSIGLFAGMGKTGDLLFHLAGAQGEGCHGTYPGEPEEKFLPDIEQLDPYRPSKSKRVTRGKV